MRDEYTTRDLIGIGFLVTWKRLARIERKLDRIQRMENNEMATLDRITQEVAENTDATGSAILLLGELAQLVRDAGTDPAALAALADTLDANSTALADAVTANTPAAPEPPA